jgi:ATP-dependent Lon protease
MKAIADLKRAVVLAPNDAQARFELGEALFLEGDAKAASKQLEKALELKAGFGDARRLLAKSYEKDGRPEQAREALTELTRLLPNDAAARDELVGLLLEQGRIDDALVHAEVAARLDASDVKRQLLFADLLMRRRLFARAKEVLETAQARFPNDRTLTEELKHVYLALGEEAQADRLAGTRDRAYYLNQAKQGASDGQVRALLEDEGLAGLLPALGLGDVLAIKDGVAQRPSSPAVEFLRGEVALIDRRFDAAEAHFRSVVAHTSAFALVFNRLGDLAQSRHALDDSVGLYKKAILLGGQNDAGTWEDLADVLGTLGRLPEATRAYAKAAALGSRTATAKQQAMERPKAPPSTQVPKVGLIGVLGWSSYGGAVSPLEAVAMEGSGQLVLSGNVGPASKEAATVAHSVLKALAGELKIETTIMKRDVHLHFTDTEVSKDGPSSGLALLLASLSAVKKLPLAAGLAATGELTLHGVVKAVGGIHEKLTSAHLAGFSKVLVPRANARDVRDLPDDVRATLRITFVDTIFDASKEAFTLEGV